MKKYTFLLLIMQACFASQDMTFEKENIVVCCKKSIQNTSFEDLSMPILYHLTITNNNKMPCLIDPSVIIKNRLIDESVLKRDIVQMLQQRNHIKSTAYGLGSLVSACVFLIITYNFYQYCNSGNTNGTQVFGSSQGSLNNFSRSSLNLFNTQAPLAHTVQNGNSDASFAPFDLLAKQNEFFEKHASSMHYNNANPATVNAEVITSDELLDASYYSSSGFFDLILLANTFTSPLAFCSLTFFLAKKYFDKAKKTTHARLNLAILSQREPMIVAPGSSVEKIFALEDTSEPIIINGDGIQTPKNFWDDMIKFFSKKK